MQGADMLCWAYFNFSLHIQLPGWYLTIYNLGKKNSWRYSNIGCLLKKHAPHFFNPTCGGTKQKEAAYPVTGKN
jgi:hypothetical protein